MAQNNNTIMAGVWLEATNDFQQRIPDPTQHGIAKTVEALFDPMNKNYYNQFLDMLVNRIGATFVRASRWDNPLAAFKGGKLNYGTTIQEIAPKWVKAHSYMDDEETVFKMERPEVRAAYHSINREDRYDITIVHDELRQAFTEEYGLNNLIAGIMTVPQNSDNYDEYLCMKQLIAEYETRWGFFKHQLSAMPTDETTGKEFLASVRTMVGKLQFPSTLYNSLAITDIPVFAKQDELILLTTPEVMGSLSVDVLASIFHVENAEVNVRQVMIDEFPIPNAVALLTTRDWFVVHDLVYTTTSMYNPKTLGTNYFLHHWEVVSASPFVPAILYTLDEGTDVDAATQSVTGITLGSASNTVDAGGTVQLNVQLNGSISPATEGISVAPDSATFEVAAQSGSGNDATPVALNSRTYVDRNFVLHVQKSGLETGNVITVLATATYINPSGSTSTYQATKAITVN